MDIERIATKAKRASILEARGFTLIELMIAVVLIAVLAALSVPTISSSMERNKTSQLNRDVANGFLHARSHAMRQGQAVLVRIQTGANSRIDFYEPANMGEAGSCVRADDQGPNANGRNVLNSVTPASLGLEHIQFQGPDPAGTLDLCIAPNGRVVGSAGQELAATGTGCDRMNFRLPMWDVRENPENLDGCVVSDDIDILRQIHNYSMIHVGYGGQVRVIK